MASQQTDGGAIIGVISISNTLLCVALAPLFVIAAVSYQMQLDLGYTLIIGALRTFIQLTILAAILQPIFSADNIYLVFGYVFVMILLATQASCSRTKYRFKGQFLGVLTILLCVISIVGSFGFIVIIRPKPLYSPQYVIPICGMLLGNCINGISLTLNHLTTSLVEQQREIDLYLSFGANYKEAISRLQREAVRSGTMPLLNSLAVIGLVAIPGMMTGQILGGSSVTDAAHYQCLIMYLITLSTFAAILLEVLLVLQIGFDSSHMLRPDRFQKVNREKKFISWCLGLGKTKQSKVPNTRDTGMRSSHDERCVLIDELADSTPYGEPSEEKLEVHKLHESERTSKRLEINNIHSSFKIIGESSDNKDTTRTLFHGLSFNVSSKEIISIRGPSGSGKTQLLRCISALSPVQEGTLTLNGVNWNVDVNKSNWRRKVRYVTQFKVDVAGNPTDFINRISKFKSWKYDPLAPSQQHLMSKTIELCSKWNVPPDCLEKEWSMLSGGESQRIILAIAFASRPDAILLDECTASLDVKNKLAVESSILELTNSYELKVLIVSHDDEQFDRLKNLV